MENIIADEKEGIINPELKPITAMKAKFKKKWDDPVPMKDWVHPDDKKMSAVKQNYRNNIKKIVKSHNIKGTA